MGGYRLGAIHPYQIARNNNNMSIHIFKSSGSNNETTAENIYVHTIGSKFSIIKWNKQGVSVGNTNGNIVYNSTK